MRLALIEPDIPQNVGAALRLAACMGVGIDVIGPTGFALSDRRLKRAGMDYVDLAGLVRHAGWTAFLADRAPGRLVLLTTAVTTSAYDFSFEANDTLMLGSESAGAPALAHAAADARLRLPMRPDARSLNVTIAAALALGEGLRQTGGLPSMEDQTA